MVKWFGKSSILDLISLLSKCDIASSDTCCLYTQQDLTIFYLNQDYYVSNLSIYDFFLTDVVDPPTDSNQVIISILSSLRLWHDLSLSDSDLYHFTLGESGCNLSGGQAQRFNIAKLIYIVSLFNQSNSSSLPVVLMDEPFSALDQEARQMAMNVLYEVCPTGLLVSHSSFDTNFCHSIVAFNS